MFLEVVECWWNVFKGSTSPRLENLSFCVDTVCVECWYYLCWVLILSVLRVDTICVECWYCLCWVLILSVLSVGLNRTTTKFSICAKSLSVTKSASAIFSKSCSNFRKLRPCIIEWKLSFACYSRCCITTTNCLEVRNCSWADYTKTFGDFMSWYIL